MTARELLEKVNQAIEDILVGGQSYAIGTRKLTRADLGELRRTRADLMEEIASEAGWGSRFGVAEYCSGRDANEYS